MFAELIIVLTGLTFGAFAGFGMRLHQAKARERRRLSGAELAAQRSRQLLGDCCDADSPGIMVDLASGNTSPVRFTGIQTESVSFETTGSGGDQECWSKRALVAVQFNLDGRARVFVAPIAEATPGTGGSTYITTSLPRYIADSEARAAFRVNMEEDEVVEAVLLHEARDFPGRLSDVSTTGMGILCKPEDLDGIEVGDDVEVQLELAGKPIQRTGIVRRVQGRLLGLSFPVITGDKVPKEQEEYFDLIRALLDREAA